MASDYDTDSDPELNYETCDERSRQDPIYHSPERVPPSIWQHVKFQDPSFSGADSCRYRMQRKRKDTEFRAQDCTRRHARLFKTEQDPYLRSQRRERQRAVMRKRREDPEYREAEKKKGIYRMRKKRMDPEYRTQERERQRERMKAKRSNPEFREREREQQKARLNMKRLDPAFRAKEKSKDSLILRSNSPGNDNATVLWDPGDEASGAATNAYYFAEAHSDYYFNEDTTDYFFEPPSIDLLASNTEEIFGASNNFSIEDDSKDSTSPADF